MIITLKKNHIAPHHIMVKSQLYRKKERRQRKKKLIGTSAQQLLAVHAFSDLPAEEVPSFHRVPIFHRFYKNWSFIVVS